LIEKRAISQPFKLFAFWAPGPKTTLVIFACVQSSVHMTLFAHTTFLKKKFPSAKFQLFPSWFFRQKWSVIEAFAMVVPKVSGCTNFGY